jgi:uncharacterized protein
LQHDRADAARSKQGFLAEKRLILADDHSRNTVEQDCPAAHGARRQRRVDRAFPIHARRLAAGILERIHLAVQYNTSLLHATIVTSAKHVASMHQHRADGDSTLLQTPPRFLDCNLHEFVHKIPPRVKRIVQSSAVLLQIILVAACARTAPEGLDIDPQILSEVNAIRAIDNHAHPVRFVASGEPDKEFDALPVDSMEAASDPLQLRPDDHGVMQAWQALWHYPNTDAKPEHIQKWKEHKERMIRQHGIDHPVWVLDQSGIDIMLANRVHMGSSIQPPRFRWVPYVDALLFPLENSNLAAANSDRKAFFADEDAVRALYLKEAGLDAPPRTLDDYLRRVVTPALERHKQGGAVAEKFEIAYLRPFGFDKVDRPVAEKVYSTFIETKDAPPAADYKTLQDFLFRFIVSECGRLDMTVHLHTGEGAGSYYDLQGANPLRLESLFNDPELRKIKFVMVHGGWPYTKEITALLYKPNAYLDYSVQPLLHTAPTLAQTLREWLEWVPEKVLFGTDAYPYGDALGWEETAWLAAKRGREALAIALTRMLRDGEISRARASELARMVLRENAGKLYRF